jgi:outer membrane protein assembly factor BamB
MMATERPRPFASKTSQTAFGLAVGLALLLVKGAASAQGGATAPLAAFAQNEWLTWGYDQERTLWNRAETVLNKENVAQLTLKWKTLIPTPPRDVVLATMTTPLVATVNGPGGPVTRVFVVGSDNTVYAVDAETGAISWQRPFPNTATPSSAPDYRCPSTQNATPVIDKETGIIYVSTSDGKLRGLSLVNGEDRMPATDFTNPFARNWSLNLIDGVIYSPTARGCLGIPSHFTAIDLKDPARHRAEFFTGPGVPAGAWGRGGFVRGPKYIYAQTADGPYDPAAGRFGNSVVALTFKELRLVDSYTAENWEYLNAKDLDLASTSPVLFPFQGKTLVASVGKESVLSLLDADDLGGRNHQRPLYRSPRWGNDETLLHDRGVWGALATWEDGQGRRYLALSMLGPPGKSAPPFKYTNGPAEDGSVMAFEVRSDAATGRPMLMPLWISRELHAPDVPVVAHGVVYTYQSGKDSTETRAAGVARRAAPGNAAAGAAAGGVAASRVAAAAAPRPSRATNAILYAFDAENGKQLFSTELDSFNHFTNPVVAGGTVYATSWDGKLYAFSLKK